MKNILLIVFGLISIIFGFKINERKIISYRIIGGIVAQDGEFPWHVTVVSRYANGRETLCGGSLIHPEWVLTSVGCANQPESITLGFGSNSLNNRAITLTAAALIRHEQFQSFIENNIALIRLPSPIVLNENIQLIALPTRAQASNLFTRQTVRIAGFGAVENEDGITSGTEPSESLIAVEKLVITNTDCGRFFWPTPLPSTVLCAEGAFRVWFGICEGDQGGALIWNDADGVPRQIGIASFMHFQGCMGGRPDGYVRVTSYLDWISENTGIVIE